MTQYQYFLNQADKRKSLYATKTSRQLSPSPRILDQVHNLASHSNTPKVAAVQTVGSWSKAKIYWSGSKVTYNSLAAAMRISGKTETYIKQQCKKAGGEFELRCIITSNAKQVIDSKGVTYKSVSEYRDLHGVSRNAVYALIGKGELRYL